MDRTTSGQPAVAREWSWTQLHLDGVLPPLRAVLAELPGDLRRGVAQVAELTVGAKLSDPPPLLLALLRRFRPRQTVKHLTLLTRARDVTAAASDTSGQYLVTPYVKPINRLAGGFVLGLDGPAHAQARRELDSVLAVADAEVVGRWAQDLAVRLLETARPQGRVDLVGEFAHPLMNGFVAEFFGVGEPDSPLAKWAWDLFEDCFLNPRGDRGVRMRAEAAAVSLREVIEATLAPLRSEPDGEGAGAPTVLAALAARYSDDERVVGDLLGLIVASVPTTAEAVIRVVDHLLDHPRVAAVAAAAAQRGDRAALAAHVRESLRFNPQSPGLLREQVCPGAGSRLVMLSTLSAMQDRDLVENPRAYRIDRPPSAYLHFGAGPHACLGESLATQLLVSAVAAVLLEPRLRRADGVRGRPTFDGPVPMRLLLRNDVDDA